jgi:hypothetical protein
MKHIFLIAAVLLQVLVGAVHAATEADVIGLYENQSESSFVFTLKLEKTGRAIYTEPDPEGGKSFVRTGKWALTGDSVTIDLGKGGSFGLEVQAIPKVGATKDSRYHVWRAVDRKKIERCHG